jgi:serine/threonine-protein kinase
VPDQLLRNLQARLGQEYRFERELEAGGMSRVFVATEIPLNRRVVIKALAWRSGDDVPISVERFRREISLTAKLQHAHIVPILTSGDIDDVPFYVMPFIDGESLRDRLRRLGPLSVNSAVAIMRDIAEALEFAHVHGVVHRDIKPGNVLMSGRSALVTDFGVAKAIAVSTTDPPTTLTSHGFTLGTPGYMAPEQAAADPDVDHRVDIYALGVTTYELLTGRTPFGTRPPASLVAAHINETPRPIDAERSGLPPGLAKLIMRCLAKEPRDRPQDATEVLAALDRLPRADDTVVPQIAAEPGPTYSTVAVLPFANLGGDQEVEYMAVGIPEAVLNALARLPTLRVTARTSSFAFKDSNLSLRDIGNKLRVSKLLCGSVRKSDQRLRVRVELVNADDLVVVWSGRFDREWKHIFEIEDEIADAIADALRNALYGSRTQPVTRAGRQPPRSLAAYDAYMKGRYFLDQRIEGMRRAMESYQRAVELDAGYALGHAGIAEAHFLLTLYAAVTPREGAPLAREAARRALALDANVAEAYVVLGNVSLWYDWDREQARRELDRAIALKPSDSLARSCYAYYYASYGAFDEAIAEARSALALDSQSLWVHSNLAVTLYLAERYEESIGHCRDIIDAAPKYSEAYRWMALSLFRLRKWQSACEMMTKAVEASGRNHWPLANLGAMLARAGRKANAEAILAELLDRAKKEAVPALAIATIYYALGERDAMFEWLERAYNARDFWLIMLPVDPGFAELRRDARFEELMGRVLGSSAATPPSLIAAPPKSATPVQS